MPFDFSYIFKGVKNVTVNGESVNPVDDKYEIKPKPPASLVKMDITDSATISYCRFEKTQKKTPQYYSFRVYQVPLEDL